MKYNWQQADWPKFRYDSERLEELVFDSITAISKLMGSTETIPEEIRQENLIEAMVQEAMKSSEIEGEFLSREDVLSSVRKQFGLSQKESQDQRANGISKVLIDVYENYSKPLCKKTLNHWHSFLFEKQNLDIKIGAFRKSSEAMQVVSGPIEKRKIHFEAPPSCTLDTEMKRFINWYNSSAEGGFSEISAAPIRAGIAHLYFESIHPYEDGNGRIGRALIEKTIAQDFKQPILLAFSSEIEAQRKDYYYQLEQAQKSNEISDWLEYFLETTINAAKRSTELIKFILKKSRFYQANQERLNPRQAKVIKRMLDQEVLGFKGGINARKYMSISKCSKATATRDLTEMYDWKILRRRGAGRSVSYDLNL